MNKSELIANISEKAGLQKKEAEQALNAFMESVEEGLSQGEKVQIMGFGTFEVRHRAARKGKNPQTGQEIDIAATISPAFKAGKTLKDKVNK